MQSDRIAFRHFGQSGHKPLAVHVLSEDVALFVASGGDVVQTLRGTSVRKGRNPLIPLFW